MTRRTLAVLVAVMMLAMAMPWVALADNVQNDVVAGGNDTITAGGSTTINYRIQQTGVGNDGQAGCNAADETPATVTINTPAGVTATPGSLNFTDCGNAHQKPVVFSSNVAGNYPITVTVSDSGAGSYTIGQADFTLKVIAPPPSDTTAPVITPNIVGTPGNNGWYISDVTISWSVVEDESAISSSSGCESTTINSDTAGTTLTCTATSAGGTASESVTIKRDASAPSAQLTVVSGTLGGNGWYNSAVTVHTSGSDSLSGIAGCTPDQLQSSETTGTTFNGSCTNGAGLVGNAAPLTIKLDTTGPSAALSVVDGNQDNSGWYTSDVTVRTTGGDSISDPTTCTDDQFLEDDTDSSGVTFNGSCVNDAGLETGAASITVKRDATQPTISANTGGYVPGEWTNQTVTISYVCDDPVPGSGLVAGACPGNDVVSADTPPSGTTLSQSVSDIAGNSSDQVSTTVKVDKTAPLLSGVPTTSANGDNGWYTSNVTIHWTCSDTLSDIAGSCPDDSTISSEGTGLTASASVSDNAGNTTNATSSPAVKIDKTNPTDVAFVGGISGGGQYDFNFVPAAPTCAASDAISGLASCVVTGYSNAVGEHTLTAKATDNAGRTSTAELSYTVLSWTISGFHKPVDMGGNVYNTVKGGATVPLKFEAFAGSTELTSTSIVSLSAKQITCQTGAVEDTVEVTTTGGTSLRYDETAGQFVYNWQTPKKAGNCYAVTATFEDGSSITAQFKLK